MFSIPPSIPAWILYAALIGIGMTSYNVIMKITGGKMDGLLFTGLFNAVNAALLLLAYVISKPASVPLIPNLPAWLWGIIVLMGALIAFLDFAYFQMIAVGGQISIASPFINLTTIGLTLIVGALFFKEQLSLTNLAGVALGILALYLLTRPA